MSNPRITESMKALLDGVDLDAYKCELESRMCNKEYSSDYDGEVPTGFQKDDYIDIRRWK